MDSINITNLGNKILYLNYTGSHIETTNFKGMGNNIYFPKFEGNHMVLYSINQYTSYGLNPCFDFLYDFNY